MEGIKRGREKKTERIKREESLDVRAGMRMATNDVNREKWWE